MQLIAQVLTSGDVTLNRMFDDLPLQTFRPQAQQFGHFVISVRIDKPQDRHLVEDTIGKFKSRAARNVSVGSRYEQVESWDQHVKQRKQQIDAFKDTV